MKITIGITDCGAKYPIYESWILSQQPDYQQFDISTVRLSYELNNFSEIQKCNGILLTGGEDIHPKYYKKTVDEISHHLALCNLDFIDEKRDEFEWKVCEYVFEKKVPVLGICRGLQLVNVFLGGTLIPDIPNFNNNNHSKFYEGKDRYHFINILQRSELSKIVGSSFGFVNSAHHQSADIVANSLIINALSDDEIVEGLEYKDFNNAQSDSGIAQSEKHFLMLVQWHPERLLDLESEFSKNLKESFLQAIHQI
jgi:putative glutamine amidotransferase